VHQLLTGCWNDFQRSLKAIGNVKVQYSAYDFLLPFHSNNGPILYHFPHIARYWSKIVKFIYLTCIQCTYRRDPIRISQRSLVLGKLKWLATTGWRKYDDMLSHCNTILERDRQMDKRTDRQNSYIDIYCAITKNSSKSTNVAFTLWILGKLVVFCDV